MFVSKGALVATTKTPLNLPVGSSWFDGMPGMAAGWPSAYAGIYAHQLWVYVVVSKLAKATARLPLPVYERSEKGRTRRDDHPMARLLTRPNPGQSGHDLMLWTSSMYDIYGDAFWLKRRDVHGTVVGLFPLHPASMRWDHDTWTFDNGSTRLDDIPSLDIVHFKAFHPTSSMWGMSPLEPLRSTLENEWSARTATSSFWQRGARPGMALSHPANLSTAAQDRLKAQMEDVAGGAGKTGATVVLEEGMTPQVMTLTAEEAQYIETRKLNREEVCAAYDVPPPVVHILDRATFSNITEQMRSMYRDTMGSRLPLFEAAIETDLRQAEFGHDDIYAEFLMDEVLRGDFETRQDALGKAVHMTIAEKRKIENLPFIDGTDRIFLNTATMPLDAIDAQAAAFGGGSDEGSGGARSLTEMIQKIYLGVGSVVSVEEARDILNRAGAGLGAGFEPTSGGALSADGARSVMGRLSWQQSLADVDCQALVQGLDLKDAAAVTLTYALVDETEGDVAELRARIKGITRPAEVEA